MNDEVIHRILRAVDEERIRHLARSLVMIPSVGYISKPVVQETVECAAFCGEYMERFGCKIAVQEDIGKQAIGTLRGTGNGSSLMLCGHIDTVPVSRGWKVDPYGGVIEGDRLYGPGAGNMKGGVASMIAAAETIVRSGIELKGDVVVAPVFGERVGGTGAKALLRSGIRSDCAVVPEPTGLNLIGVESTGGMDGVIHVHGEMGLFTGVHALDKMWNLLTHLGIPGENGTVHRPKWLRADPSSETPRFFVGALDAGIGEHRIHEPKGTADICTAYFDVRPTYLDQFPTEQSVLEDLESVIREYQAGDPDLQVDYECPLPGATNGIAMTTPSDAKIVTTLAKWGESVTESKVQIGRSKNRGQTSTGLDDDYLPRAKWNYQDGGHLSKAGIVSCVYGPSSGGSSNCPNEYTQLSEVVKAAKIFALTIADICT